ncbi:hypothetical protein GCM10010106_45640 [Thermopolyspora flexuosa]|nr:hypothetical protein GCM10010106_45640 [Thermopolyspora flexuosa]
MSTGVTAYVRILHALQVGSMCQYRLRLTQGVRQSPVRRYLDRSNPCALPVPHKGPSGLAGPGRRGSHGPRPGAVTGRGPIG